MLKFRGITLAALLAVFVAGSYAKSYRAERYDVLLKPDKAGLLEVTETVVFRFTGGPFQFVFRDIATTETDGISDVRAWMDGNLLPPGDQAGQVEIEGRAPVKVRWHFAPLSDETHTFVVQYRVAGAIRKEADSDSLIWRALPPQRKYRIDASEIVLQYPDGMAPATVGTSGKRAAIMFESGRAVARLSDVKSDARVTLRAEFAKDSFQSPTPSWMVRKQNRTGDFLAALQTASMVALPLVAAAMLLLVRLRSPEWTPGSAGSPGSVTQPPSEVGPAVAARFAGTAHGAAGLLLDLARRGIVRIEETEKRRFGSRDFRVVRAAAVRGLAPHEERFLEILFPDAGTDILMSKAGPRIRSKWRKVASAVDSELLGIGLLNEEKRRKRNWMIAGGLIGLVPALATIGIGAKFATEDQAALGGILVVIGASILILTIFSLIGGATLSEWTVSGTSVAAQWKAFRDHLKELTKDRAPMPGPDAVDRFLPYAAAFGVAAALLKRQQKTGAVALPAWFAAFGSSGDGAAIASYIAFLSASDAGSSSGVSAGAGASGGGSSGAG